MAVSFLPIVERELRLAARRPAIWRTRVAAAAVIIGVWLAAIFFGTRAISPQRTAQILFGMTSWMVFGFGLLVGVFAASDSVSEERREGTLGLLFLTELRGVDVVLGKLAATSLNAVYALTAMLPVLAISLFMGGVTPGEFSRAVLVLFATVSLSLCSAMMISVFCRDARTAMIFSFGAMLLIASLPPFIWWVVSTMIRKPALADLLLRVSPASTFWLAGDASFARKSGPWEFWSSWSFLVALSITCLLIACFSLPHVWREIEPLEQSHWLAKKWRQWRFPQKSSEPYSIFTPINQLAARDRLPRLLAGLLFAVVTPVWLTFLIAIARQGSGASAPTVIPFLCISYALHVLFKFLVATETARRLGDDLRSGALELLLVTPVDEKSIIYGHSQSLWKLFKPALLTLAGLNFIVFCAAIVWLKWTSDARDYFAVMVFGGTVMLVVDFDTLIRVGMVQALQKNRHGRALVATLSWVMGPPWIAVAIIFFSNIVGGGNDPRPIMILWMIVSLAYAAILNSMTRAKLAAGLRQLVHTKEAR